MIELKKIPANCAPMSLLLEADPSEACINRYLPNSACFAALDDNVIVGICVSKGHSDTMAEIYNIAIDPAYQQQGIGTLLLPFVLRNLVDMGFHRIELGTGSFGYQLTFYQRHGFRVDAVLKDFFLDNYAEAIYENGIQHKDMLRLVFQPEMKTFKPVM